MTSTGKLNPDYKRLEAKLLIGMSTTMSITTDATYKLFSSFMPRRKEIVHLINSNTLDLRIYPTNYFRHFDPNTEFTKWALVEVESAEPIPMGMQKFDLKSGLYAVFTYTGDIHETRIFQEIFTFWLPNSEYTLDDRPHFEIMFPCEKKQNIVKQEIYIPIK